MVKINTFLTPEGGVTQSSLHFKIGKHPKIISLWYLLPKKYSGKSLQGGGGGGYNGLLVYLLSMLNRENNQRENPFMTKRENNHHAKNTNSTWFYSNIYVDPE